MADEARNLKQYKELPENSMLLLLLDLVWDGHLIFARVLSTNVVLQSVSTRQIPLPMRKGSTMNTLTLKIFQVLPLISSFCLVDPYLSSWSLYVDTCLYLTWTTFCCRDLVCSAGARSGGADGAAWSWSYRQLIHVYLPLSSTTLAGRLWVLAVWTSPYGTAVKEQSSLISDCNWSWDNTDLRCPLSILVMNGCGVSSGLLSQFWAQQIVAHQHPARFRYIICEALHCKKGEYHTLTAQEGAHQSCQGMVAM